MNQSRGIWFYLTYMSLLIINSTNRNNSGTAQLIQKVETLCLASKIDFKTIQLEDFSSELSNPELYHEENWPIEMIDYQEEVIIPSHKFLFIIPEYNGSFPGILKLWIDVLSVRKRNETFKFKKYGLVGISEGKSSNQRGLDHFMGIARYLQMIAFPNNLLIPGVNKILKNWPSDEDYDRRMITFLNELEAF